VPLEAVVVSSDPQLPAPCRGRGLTLSVFTPFASPTPPVGRVGDVYSWETGDVEHTLVVDFLVITPTIGATYAAHSPELPQFSTVQLESVPWTILDSNQTHDAWTVVKSTGPVLLSERIHPSCANRALSDLSHYQPD